MILVQKPTIEDVQGIQEVFYTSWMSTYPNKKAGITVEDVDEHLKNNLSNEEIEKSTNYIMNLSENELFLIAKEDRVVLGVCRVIKGEKYNQLESIYVLPKYQGKGIGSLFWEKAKKFAGNKKDIILRVATYNSHAILFFKQRGFVDTGKRFMDPNLRMPISGSIIPEMGMILKGKKK